MKKATLILILGFLIITGNSIQAQMTYPIKTGSIAYTMSMMGTDNLMTMYFSDNGNVQCTETQMEMFGMKIHNRSIVKDKKTFTLDMTQKTYTETDLSAEDFEKMNFFSSDDALAKEGATKVGEEEILGRNCQIYKLTKDGADMKMWIWKGMMLKMETVAQGMTINMVATAITESAPDASIFEVPSDFTKSN